MWRNRYSSWICLLLFASFSFVYNSQSIVICESDDACDANYGYCNTTSKQCECYDGFAGDGATCESNCISSSISQTCPSDLSSCIDLSVEFPPYACLCDIGYTWNIAGLTCVDTDECTMAGSCADYTTCTNAVGSYSCECCYKNDASWKEVTGFGYVGDGMSRCYAEAIIHYNDSTNPQQLEGNGYLHTTLTGGFPYYGRLHWDIYFHTNGLITFDSPDAPYFGGNAFPTHRDVVFVAPFWTGLMPSGSDESGLFLDEYSDFSGQDGKDVSSVDTFIPNLRNWLGDINLPGFQPKQVLVATWNDMVAISEDSFSPEDSSRVTFQTVLLSNGTHSFGFTSYDEKVSNWSLPMSNVYIGFSGEHEGIRHPFDEFEELFQNAPFSENMCNEMTFLTLRGRFYKVFGEPFSFNRNPRCIEEALRQTELLPHLSPDSPPGVPRDYFCPCFEQQASSDSRFIHIRFEARSLCYLSRFYHEPLDNFNKTRSYCCYDVEGALILHGVGAGALVPDSHEFDMAILKRECCTDADLCDVFQYLYPPVSCEGYPRPGVAYIRGAGHFNGFNGSAYTFNGRGEFTYFWKKDRQIEAQVRFQNRTFDSNEATSFITAMAAKCEIGSESHIVEVRVSEMGALEVLVDGEVTEVGDSPDGTSDFYLGCRGNRCELACEFPKEIYSIQVRLVNNEYLEIELSSPVFDTEGPSGIVGFYDGRLEYLDDTGKETEVGDYEDDAQITAFADFNRIASGFSLFTYNRNDSYEDYNDGYFVPSYWTDVQNLIDHTTADQVAHCMGDFACQYDQMVTGDKEVSRETYRSKVAMNGDRDVMATMTSQWQAGPFIEISIHENFEGSLMPLVQYDEENIGSTSPMPNPADSFELDTNIPDELYRFDPETGNYTIFTRRSPSRWRHDSYYINIYALKNGPGGVVSKSKYSPSIFMCACEEEGQCDYSFVNRTALERSTNENGYYTLPCSCPANTTDRFCAGDFDICATHEPCDTKAECTNDAESPSGYKCICNNGYSGNGLICTLNDCHASNDCSQNCYLDSETADRICSCNPGYILADDGKTCYDRNECNYPQMCPDENSICRNTEGSYYCECEVGYKAYKKDNDPRWECLEALYSYKGSLTFIEYYDVKSQFWKGWEAELENRDSLKTQQLERQLEPFVEELIKLVIPSVALGDDLFTYIYEFSDAGSGKMKMSFKFYPSVEVDAAASTTTLKQYITDRGGEAAGFKGIDAASATFETIVLNDYCAATGCSSLFSNCHNSEVEAVCRCDPGFAEFPIALPDVPLGTCKSHCSLEPCSDQSAHSCRDNAQIGRQCLCKKGYELNADNSCTKVDACLQHENPCGDNARCSDNGDGTFECICNEGYLKALRPAPDQCVPDIILMRNSMDVNDFPSSVEFDDSFANHYKIAIPVGFPYGLVSKQWKIYVGPNGIISLGENITASEIASFHPSKYGYLIAPLWTDFVWDKSKMTVKIFDSTTSTMTEEWQNVIDDVVNSTFLAAVSYPAFNMFGFPTLTAEAAAAFDPKTVFIVTWNDLVLLPFEDEDRVTMQTVIASDGLRTVVMFNYDPATTSIKSWEDPVFENDPERSYNHRGFAGFQDGDRQFCLNRVSFGESRVDCRHFYPNMLMDSKGLRSLPPGRHMFMVHNTDQIDSGTQGDRKCFDALKTYEEDYVTHPELAKIEQAIDDQHPDSCPWTQVLAAQDKRFEFHQIAKQNCFSKRFHTSMNYQANDGSDQSVNVQAFCCYHSHALVRNLTHMIIKFEDVAEQQGAVLNSCCIKSAHCELTSLIIPPNYVIDGYEPPVTGGVYGDPHLLTFFGDSITFKGLGDYVLFNSSDVQIQGRFDQLNESTEGAGLKAIAWQFGDSAVVAAVSNETGINFTLNGIEIDLTQPQYWLGLGGFDTAGNIESTVDSTRTKVESVTMTYTNGMSFELNRLVSSFGHLYLHATVRIVRQHREQGRGLMAAFYYPDGTAYQPTFENGLPALDRDFFNYGKSWSVADAGVMSLFPDEMPPMNYTPPFFEDVLASPSSDTPLYDACRNSMQCAYDFNVTGDPSVAMSTLAAAERLQSLHDAENERPPTFMTKLGDFVWNINVAQDFKPFTFKPEIEAYNDSSIIFTYDTNFPRHLFQHDPLLGILIIRMDEEVRDTFLNKGPFYFYVVATNGKSGAAAFSPIAIRICNCLDERSCDFSDEADSSEVGIIPSQVARCNCFSYLTGKFCNQQYDACTTKPCYSNVECHTLEIPEMQKPSFSCGRCPFGFEGNGFHCIRTDPCRDVTCPEGQACQDVNGYGRCLCPGGERPDNNGECQYQDACDQFPPVCRGHGAKCNTGAFGSYWCDCVPGYAPVYDMTLPGLELDSCQPIKYTYAGSLQFDSYYNISKDLVNYWPNLDRFETMEYQQFARRVLNDLENAASLLTNDIVGVYISGIRNSSDGFELDYFTYSNVKFTDTAAIDGLIEAYFAETGNVGVVVSIRKDSPTFVDICDSPDYSPCRDINQIATCTQNGFSGEGAVCSCNETLAYETEQPEHGEYECDDKCDSICKAEDPKSQCQRISFEKYLCTCVDGYYYETTTKTCEPNCEKLADSCRNVTNAYGCRNIADGYECLCNSGYRWDERLSLCRDVNECREETYTCPDYTECQNTVGGYYCQCGEDFVASDSTNTTCYVRRNSMLYPYNLQNEGPTRDNNSDIEFRVAGGFQYGQSYVYSAHVGFNGYVGLDAPPPYKYIGMALDHHVITPFWADLDFLPDDPESGLYIDAFDSFSSDNATKEQWQPLFDLALKHLQTQYPESDNPNLQVDETVPMAMLVLTWVKVTPAPASNYKDYHATFQAVLCANSGFSFFIFNYLNDPVYNKWPTYKDAPTLQPYIGYTIGRKELVYQPLNGEPPRYDAIFDIKNSRQLPGRVVVALAQPVPRTNRDCIYLRGSFPKDGWNAIKQLGSPGSGIEKHGACPAFLDQMAYDSRWRLENVVSGSRCYGGNFWHEGLDSTTNITYNARSICCYDVRTGSFLGFPRNDPYVRSYLEIEEFRDLQKAMFDACCRFSTYCEVFGMPHSPAEAIAPEYYDQPVIAYVRGDPHIGMPLHNNETTSRQLTFNGRGEYTFFKSLDNEYGNITVQIRFTRRTELTENATFTTGIAIQAAMGDIVEVINDNEARAVFRNGEQVDLNFLPPINEVVSSSDYDLWATDDVFGYTTITGLTFHITYLDSAYFNIRVSLPRGMSSNMMLSGCGLLGSFDSTYKDCDGAAASGDIWNNEQDAFNFGQQFKIRSESESLFSYKAGPSYNEVNNVEAGWEPIFSGDVIPPSDVLLVCGVKDTACRYDYGVTSSSVIAEQTKQFGDTLQMVQSNSVETRPIIENEEMVVTADLTYENQTFEIDVNSTQEGIDSFYYELLTNVASDWYGFDSATGMFTITTSYALRDYVRTLEQPPYMRFVAVKGAASGIWAPPLWTCACEESDQCDWSIVTELILYREKKSTLNYFVPCKCPPTTRGQFCEFPFDVCEGSGSNPCGEGVRCINNPNSASGFSCGICPPNYDNADGVCKLKVCPADYCTTGNCHVSTEDGSYFCTCTDGYELSATDGTSCKDIDECVLGTHDCPKYGSGYQCTNTAGSYACGCKIGFAPDNTTNFQTCVTVPNQLHASMEFDSVIVNGVAQGWTDDLNDPTSDTYKSVTASLQESLLKWYIDDLGQTSVTSVVVTQLSQPTTRASSIVSDYKANSDSTLDANAVETAQKDFLTTGGTISGVEGVNVDTIGVTSDPCETSENNCDLTSTTCYYDTTAILLTCNCLDGYVAITGTDRTCADDCTNICVGQLGSNAECDRTNSTSYTCQCKTNYYQSAGTCKSACEPSPCENGGTCLISGTSHICQCSGNYLSGTNCTQECNCVNGICADDTNPDKCACNEGFTGTTCTDCMEGYESDGSGNCIDKCTNQACSDHGTCTIREGEAYCVCSEGYSGTECSGCDTGYELKSGACKSKCESFSCQNSGTCFLNSVGAAECKCADGYTGDNCETTAMTSCDTNICENNGICFINDNGDPECKCADDYTGDTCQTEAETVKQDDTNLIIVASVLGSICFILLCVVLGFACLIGKNKKPEPNDAEVPTRHSSTSSDASIPQFHQPVKAQTAFATATSPPVIAPAVASNTYAENHRESEDIYAPAMRESLYPVGDEEESEDF